MKKINDPTFVVDADGVLVTAVGIGSKDKVLIRSDDAALVERVIEAADTQTEVTIVNNAAKFTAGWDTEIGILAALVASAPGRTYIKEAPEVALQQIWDRAENQPNTVY